VKGSEREGEGAVGLYPLAKIIAGARTQLLAPTEKGQERKWRLCTEAERENVGDRQAEQVKVGRRVHGAISGDDDTRRDVADDTRQQDRRVDDRQYNRLPQTTVSPAEVRPDVLGLVQRTDGRVGTVGDGRSRSR